MLILPIVHGHTNFIFFAYKFYVNPGQCKSAAQCKTNSEIRYHATEDRPLGANKGMVQGKQTTTRYLDTKKKEECRSACERLCKQSWSGCVAFSSKAKDDYGGHCDCYGYTTPPDFGEYPDVEIWNANYLSGECLTGWFETDTL